MLEEMKQLLLLSKNQLIALISKFTDTGIQDYAELYPYLQVILFDQLHKTKLSLNTVQQYFTESMQKNSDPLKRVTLFMKKVLNSINSKAEPFEPIISDSQSFVINASRLNEMQLLCIIIQTLSVLETDINNSISLIQQGQIFSCDEKTSIQDIEHFNLRRQAFPHLTYIVLGVDQLQSSVREAILKHEAGRQYAQGTTYFVFKQSTGIDAFSFLQTKEVALFKESDFTSYLKKLVYEQKFYKFIESCEIVSGPSCGKTKFITRKIQNQLNQTIHVRISVHEDFCTLHFMNRYKKVKFHCILMHLHLQTLLHLKDSFSICSFVIYL